MVQIGAALLALKEILTMAMKIYALWKESQEKQWVTDGRKITEKLTEAKTDEERKALAQSLFDHRA